jgi:hypothetical protein
VAIALAARSGCAAVAHRSAATRPYSSARAIMASRRIARSSCPSVGLAERILRFSVTTCPPNDYSADRPNPYDAVMACSLARRGRRPAGRQELSLDLLFGTQPGPAGAVIGRPALVGLSPAAACADLAGVPGPRPPAMAGKAPGGSSFVATLRTDGGAPGPEDARMTQRSASCSVRW